jgi:DNA polymerase-3 subunit gamma/tau
MSYQVLARKYRPGNFQALEGQTHVLQALINALDSNRLHHAYLFSGTRGVGKTTIARIFAKCLNCESGVTSTPCDQCASCTEIASGRSVDLIEIDAASRTGVDDMRELLDNVQYMPTSCRYKVYLIDEVHMLSKSSFNAMLKTLEEPPEHVKFLFATTDPKKLPITVLSRCLQFNLKNMTPERVVNHLREVLAAEQIEAEEAALWQLGRAADGSMRDALSLTDQAIAFSKGQLSEASVSAMLGTVDRREVFGLLQALSARDGPALYQQIQDIAAYAPDFMALLDEMLSVLHRLAIVQIIPAGIDNSFGDREQLEGLAGQLSKEEVQLFYQVGLIGKRDLPLAPDPQIGFEMVLIRMLAFELDGLGAPSRVSPDPGQEPLPPGEPVEARQSSSETPISGLLDRLNNAAPSAKPVEPAGGGESGPKEAAKVADKVASSGKLASFVAQAALSSAQALSQETENVADQPETGQAAGPEEPLPETATDLNTELTQNSEQPKSASPGLETPGETEAIDAGHWPLMLEQLALNGITQTLASNCCLQRLEGNEIVLILDKDHSSLCNDIQIQRIAEALGESLGRKMDLTIEISELSGATPAMIAEQRRLQMLEDAVLEIESDGNVQSLIAGFGARVVQGSISPVAKKETR